MNLGLTKVLDEPGFDSSVLIPYLQEVNYVKHTMTFYFPMPGPIKFDVDVMRRFFKHVKIQIERIDDPKMGFSSMFPPDKIVLGQYVTVTLKEPAATRLDKLGFILPNE